MTFARTQPDGVWLGGGYVPSAADWSSIDAKIAAAVNGARGGTWSPAALISLSGASFTVTGPTLVAYGGVLTPSVVRLDGAAYPAIGASHPLRKRTVLETFTRFQAANVPVRSLWTVRSDSVFGLQAIALLAATVNSGVEPLWFRSPLLSVHDGAQLSAAVLTFRVPVLRRIAPIRMPRVRIVAVDLDGNVTPLGPSSDASDTSGFQSIPTPSSAEAWYANGEPQEFAYVLNANTVIDVSTYCYWIEVEEEGATLDRTVTSAILDGVFLRELKADVVLAGTPAALTGVQVVDGTNTATGMRVLVIGMANPVQNGIYIANDGGTWARAADLANASQVTPGALIRANQGIGFSSNRGKYFSLDQSGVTPGVAALTFTELTTTAYTGNIYHSLRLEFDGISELRYP
jgi:hypothetical protein